RGVPRGRGGLPADRLRGRVHRPHGGRRGGALVAKVSMELIKKLRDLSGAGMMDCRSALEEADGDVDKAYTILREKGIAKAGKRAGRATGQGVVEAYLHKTGDFPPQVGVLVEVNCETDFVAK